MDRREADALDRYITGNYGEDQFENEEEKRCSCGAPIPCLAPKYGGQHVRPEIWQKE